MLHFLSMYYLKQVNPVPNWMSRFLDLFLTNMTICSVTKSCSPLVSEDSYHPVLNMNIEMTEVQEKTMNEKAYIYNYTKDNFLLLYQLIFNCDCVALLSCRDVDMGVEDSWIVLCLRLGKGFVSAARFPLWFSLVRKTRNKNRQEVRCIWH